MLNKTAFLLWITACVTSLNFPAYVSAGDVKLLSDTWDSVCRVEVAWGPDAPAGDQVEFFYEVQRNWSITKADKLCYRRASTPDNCDSGMTQWNTRWRCATNATSDIEELSLQ